MQQPYKDELLFSAFYTIFKRKWLIFWTIIAIFLVTVLMVGLMTPRFEGSSQVLVDLNPRYQVVLFPDLTAPSSRISGVDPTINLVEMLTNRKMAIEVVEEFGLDEVVRMRRTESNAFRDVAKRSIAGMIRGFQGFLGGIGIGPGAKPRTDEYWFDEAVDEFMSDWNRIEIERDTSIINVAILGPNPELARRISDWMVSRLTFLVAKQTRNKFIKMQGFVSDNIEDAEARLNAASEALETFLGESDPAALERERELLLARQSAMHTDLADATANREGARTRFTELQKQFEDQDLRSLTREEVEFRQPGVTLLRTEYESLQAQMAALSVDLTEDHPTRKELQARIDRTRELIEEAVAEDFYSRIKTEETNPRFIESMAQLADAVAAETVAEARIAALEALQQQDAARLQELNGELAAAENGRMEFDRQFQAAESYYLSLKQRSLEIDALANNPEGEFDLRVIDPAHNPNGDEMSMPKWGLVFPFTFLAAVLFSLILAFFLEYWRNAFRSSWEFEAETGAEVIVTIPRITRTKT